MNVIKNYLLETRKNFSGFGRLGIKTGWSDPNTIKWNSVGDVSLELAKKMIPELINGYYDIIKRIKSTGMFSIIAIRNNPKNILEEINNKRAWPFPKDSVGEIYNLAFYLDPTNKFYNLIDDDPITAIDLFKNEVVVPSFKFSNKNWKLYDILNSKHAHNFKNRSIFNETRYVAIYYHDNVPLFMITMDIDEDEDGHLNPYIIGKDIEDSIDA